MSFVRVREFLCYLFTFSFPPTYLALITPPFSFSLSFIFTVLMNSLFSLFIYFILLFIYLPPPSSLLIFNYDVFSLIFILSSYLFTCSLPYLFIHLSLFSTFINDLPITFFSLTSISHFPFLLISILSSPYSHQIPVSIYSNYSKTSLLQYYHSKPIPELFPLPLYPHLIPIPTSSHFLLPPTYSHVTSFLPFHHHHHHFPFPFIPTLIITHTPLPPHLTHPTPPTTFTHILRAWVGW